MTIKPRIDAQGMTEIKSVSNEILRILWDRVSDIAIDQCQTDIIEDEDKALDEEDSLSRIIVDMIIADVKREF